MYKYDDDNMFFILLGYHLLKTKLVVWSFIIVSLLLVSWSVICCQDCDSYFMIHQRRIAEEYLSLKFEEHCLDDFGCTAAKGL